MPPSHYYSVKNWVGNFPLCPLATYVPARLVHASNMMFADAYNINSTWQLNGIYPSLVRSFGFADNFIVNHSRCALDRSKKDLENVIYVLCE